MEYAATCGEEPMHTALRQKSRSWYADDADCPAWEPDGEDFLSPALTEALCMAHALAPADFTGWLQRFLPRLAAREPATLFRPATVSDRTDGKIVHLDGLNLSRAWCWRSLGDVLAAGDPRREIALDCRRGPPRGEPAACGRPLCRQSLAGDIRLAGARPLNELRRPAP